MNLLLSIFVGFSFAAIVVGILAALAGWLEFVVWVSREFYWPFYVTMFVGLLVPIGILATIASYTNSWKL